MAMIVDSRSSLGPPHLTPAAVLPFELQPLSLSSSHLTAEPAPKLTLRSLARPISELVTKTVFKKRQCLALQAIDAVDGRSWERPQRATFKVCVQLMGLGTLFDFLRPQLHHL